VTVGLTCSEAPAEDVGVGDGGTTAAPQWGQNRFPGRRARSQLGQDNRARGLAGIGSMLVGKMRTVEG